MISIIIPLYNVEDYIIRCISSFENQIYKDFELLIVNDGSTDNSKQIVEEYIKNSEMNIRLVNQPNSGVSAARNKGIEEASGNYICFVDADDMVVNEYLSQMIGNLEDTNSDMVICGIKHISDEHSENSFTFKNVEALVMDSGVALEKYLYKELVSGMGSFMIKKKVLEGNNLRFALGYRYSEDQELLWKMISHSKRVAYNKNQLYLYRIRPGSAMSFVDNKRLDGLKLMKDLEGYFKKVRPDFYHIFKKYGVARWVWATLWQSALASNNLREFKEATNIYNPKHYFKFLLTYPDKRVQLSSSLYLISQSLYYLIVKTMVVKDKR